MASNEPDGKKFDAEIEAMTKIFRTLEPLDQGARSRILAATLVLFGFVDPQVVLERYHRDQQRGARA